MTLTLNTNAFYSKVKEFLPITENYLDICKFNNRSNNKYKIVRIKIKEIIKVIKITEVYKIRGTSSKISLISSS